MCAPMTRHRHAPQPATWRRAGSASHGFTHFELSITLYAAEVPSITSEGFLRPADALAGEALPSVMRKCLAAMGVA